MNKTMLPATAIHKAGYYILILLACFLGWYYLQVPLAVALLASAVSSLVIWKTLPRVASIFSPENRIPAISASALAVLFCLMMPITWFYRGNPLYQPLNDLHLPYRIKFLAGVLGNTASLLFVWVLCFLVIYHLWGWLRGLRLQPSGQGHSLAANVKIGLLYGLPELLIWFLFLYAYWPGILSSDSYDIWLQLSGVWRLNDWHPVTYTLTSFLLTRLWYTPAVLCIAQIILMAGLFGNAMRLFEQRGLPRKVLLPLSVVFAILPFNPILMVTVWKDIPYAILNFYLVYLLGLIWLTGGAWLGRRRNQVLLGIVMTLPYLFRHNGLLILILVPPALFLLFPARWKSSLVSVAVAICFVLGLRNGIEYGLLNPIPVPDSVKYVVPVQHIAAVMKQVDSAASPRQIAVLERVAPISVWREVYNSYDADTINKSWGLANDPEIYQKISSNKTELMAIFVDFSLRYPVIVARSQLALSSLLWEFSTPQAYLDRKLDFLLSSTPPFSILDARLFSQPRLNSPLTKFLNRYLLVSTENLFLYAILWKGGVALFLTIACAVFFSATKGRAFLLLCIPTFANVLSLAVSMSTPNFRYAYPFVICALPIFLFGLLQNRQPSVVEGLPGKL